MKILTKSRFKIGSECPRKLVYNDDPLYGNKKHIDDFLKSLAEGGFQVGEYAKKFTPGGIEIHERDHQKAWEETQKLLMKDHVVIYEAAFLFDGLFVKCDILVKSGPVLKVYEVKAKSVYGSDPGFRNRSGNLDPKWKPYLLDCAFQKWVIKKCYPDVAVNFHLTLMDKEKKSTVSGIHQSFLLSRGKVDGKDKLQNKVIIKKGTTQESLGDSLLANIGIDLEIDELWNQTYFDDFSFDSLTRHLSQIVQKTITPKAHIGGACKTCEFRIKPNDFPGKKSGFETCWKPLVKSPHELQSRGTILDIWKLHHTKRDEFFANNLLFLDQLEAEDLKPKSKKPQNQTALSNWERQWLQVIGKVENKNELFFNKEHILQAMNSWTYPLHFIDFETSRSALSFHSCMAPYDQLAFQFSHHKMEKSGKVTHESQFLHFERGEFPNFHFIRALKSALSNDKGCIFRYHTHENSVLNDIKSQLRNSNESDKDDLIEFIESITSWKEIQGGKKIEKSGARNMVDLYELVKDAFYHPLMEGSISIKKVLPTVLEISKSLQKKYSKPIYGKGAQINSLNFEKMAWINFDNQGRVKDPYQNLPPVFDGFLTDDLILDEDEEIAAGGAAMTAYCRMQFSEMTNSEREQIRAALLRYCELDTLAMVMITEFFMEMTK